jgi:hypothetical protein
MAGISSDHTDAAIITPEAKPRKNLFRWPLMLLLKKIQAPRPAGH